MAGQPALIQCSPHQSTPQARPLMIHRQAFPQGVEERLEIFIEYFSSIYLINNLKIISSRDLHRALLLRPRIQAQRRARNHKELQQKSPLLHLWHQMLGILDLALSSLMQLNKCQIWLTINDFLSEVFQLLPSEWHHLMPIHLQILFDYRTLLFLPRDSRLDLHYRFLLCHTDFQWLYPLLCQHITRLRLELFLAEWLLHMGYLRWPQSICLG